MDAAPHDLGDVVAQLIQIAHNVNVAIDDPTEDRRVQVNLQLNRAIRFLADYADIDLGEVGGNTYLTADYPMKVIS